MTLFFLKLKKNLGRVHFETADDRWSRSLLNRGNWPSLNPWFAGSAVSDEENSQEELLPELRKQNQTAFIFPLSSSIQASDIGILERKPLLVFNPEIFPKIVAESPAISEPIFLFSEVSP